MEKYIDTIRQAFDSIRSQKLRAFFTLLSIVIGVFAIMFAGSLVTSIDNTVKNQIEELGQSTFFIYRIPNIMMGGHDWRKYAQRPEINLRVFENFKKKMDPSVIITGMAKSMGMTIKYNDKNTDPDVTLAGTDDNYFLTSNYDVQEGRALTSSDIEYKRNVAIIGNDVIVKIFPGENPIGKEIKINNKPFTVIGTLKPKGAILGQSQDNVVMIPLSQFLTYYASDWYSDITIIVRAPDKIALPYLVDEAVGAMRTVRNLKPWQENDFEIETNESLADQFSSLTNFLSYFGFFSGLIALIAAGVGITNIMLITVKERTREIGIRKAVGAKKRWILTHFISETIVLTMIGGLIGVLLGIVAGGLLGLVAGTSFSLSTKWIIISLSISLVLGLISGVMPAYRAASLDPVEALRYE